MSIFSPAPVRCPACASEVDLQLVQSINADRRPDLRQEILDDAFQRVTCEACSETFRVEPELTCLDVAHGLWISAWPIDDYTRWSELERRAADTYGRAFGVLASGPAKAMGRSLRPRVVFGWPAFREKLLCGAHGLDDVALELTKVLILRAGGDPPLADTVELRLVGVEGEELLMRWLSTVDQRTVEDLRVPCALLDGVVADPQGFASLREGLTAGLYVDMNRLLVEG